MSTGVRHHRITEWLRLEGTAGRQVGSASQDYVQITSACLWRWWLQNLSGKPAPLLSHTLSKAVFSDVEREPLVLQFVPMCWWPGTEKSLSLSSLHPPFRYLHALMRSPLMIPPLLWAEQSQFSRPLLTGEVLLSLNYLFSWPFAGLPPARPCLSGRSTPGMPSPALSRGKDHLPCLLVVLCLKQPGTFRHLCHKDTLLAGPPGPFLWSCFPAGQPPAHTGTGGKVWHFLTSLNFYLSHFLTVPFLKLVSYGICFFPSQTESLYFKFIFQCLV